MTTYNVKIEGIRPLLMHNGRLADPMNEHTREVSRLVKVAKKDKTEESQIEAQRAEFVGGLYYHEEVGPVLPTDNLQAALLEGARIRKNGQLIESFVEVLPGKYGDNHKLVYKGPRDVDSLWADPRFRLTKGVRVGQAKVQRTRPRFDGWSVEFEIDVLPGGPDGQTIHDALADAGARKGVGDWTPRYGRFVVTSFEAVKS
jgi:hypothetical protein